MLKSIKVLMAAFFFAFMFAPLSQYSKGTGTVPLLFFAIPFVLACAKEQTVSSSFGYYLFSLVEMAGLVILISYLYQIPFEAPFKLTLFGDLLLALAATYAILLILEIYQVATGTQIMPGRGRR